MRPDVGLGLILASGTNGGGGVNLYFFREAS